MRVSIEITEDPGGVPFDGRWSFEVDEKYAADTAGLRELFAITANTVERVLESRGQGRRR